MNFGGSWSKKVFFRKFILAVQFYESSISAQQIIHVERMCWEMFAYFHKLSPQTGFDDFFQKVSFSTQICEQVKKLEISIFKNQKIEFSLFFIE